MNEKTIQALNQKKLVTGRLAARIACGQRTLPAQTTANNSQVAVSECRRQLVDFRPLMKPAEPLPPTVRLDELAPRVCAVVRSVETDDEDTQRLKTLGVCVGRRVELVRAGNPLIVKIFGSRLGLSAELAARVRVEICSPDHCALKEPEDP